MNEIVWKHIIVSPCETFHLLNGKPLYSQQYSQVMKFHEPGLAPVKSESHAFHIDVQGLPAYSHRYIETFGFYERLAAVRNEEGCFHVNTEGVPIYLERYDWCGNFQEHCCPVRDKITGLYFHINCYGQEIYQKQYRYVGDFKDGSAVVCNELGLHTHIDYQGNTLHNCWFKDLDVYHKRYARAEDERGWFHINKQGIPIYKARYQQVEPFYNGVARVKTFEGDLITINTVGDTMAQLSSASASWQALSNEMVGFWHTEIIAAAASLKLFDYLPGTIAIIQERTRLPIEHLERLLRALWSLNLVLFQEDVWTLTKKGELLVSKNDNFLGSAAIMWSDTNSARWKDLGELIRSGYNQYTPVFKVFATDQKLIDYHRAMDGYAKKDAHFLLSLIDWALHNTVIGVERNSKVLLEKLLIQYSHLRATLLGEEYILKYVNVGVDIAERFFLKAKDLLKPWDLLVDAVLLPKILLSWPDTEVVKILKNAARALLPGGKIYLFEMILTKNTPNGSLLDLNMLIETGGKLRFITDWEHLFCKADLNVEKNIMIDDNSCLFILQP